MIVLLLLFRRPAAFFLLLALVISALAIDESDFEQSSLAIDSYGRIYHLGYWPAKLAIVASESK